MAGLEVLGAVASALQLADLSVKLISQVSDICRRYREHPHMLSKQKQSLEQMQQVVDFIGSKKPPDIDLVQPLLDGCIEDVNDLITLLEPLVIQRDDHPARRLWRTVCTMIKEKRILDAFRELETRKASLLLCLGVGHSKILKNVDDTVTDMSADMQRLLHENRSIRQSLEVIQESFKTYSHSWQDIVVFEDIRPYLDLDSFLPLEVLDERDMGFYVPDVPTATKLSNYNDGNYQAHIPLRGAHRVQSMSDATLVMTPSRAAGHNLPATADSFSHARRRRASVMPFQNRLRSTERFLVPSSFNPSFTGRSETIQEMEDYFFSGNRREPKRLVLHGLGGVGKSQIATAFVYQAYSTGRYSTVLWILAVDRQSIIRSFAELAELLGLQAKATIQEKSSDVPASAAALLDWLARNDCGWLLVFDNIDDLDSFDDSFFPRVPWGHILITSRCTQTDRLGHPVLVDLMAPDEAVKLLYRCSRKDLTEDDQTVARRLVERLGFLPLMIDQAGAYVSEYVLSFQEYEDLWLESHAKRAELLNHRPPRAVWSYDETTLTTWELSYEAVTKKDPLAAKLLDLAAYFPSDAAPLALLCRIAQGRQSADRLFLRDFLPFIKSQDCSSQLAGPVPTELKATAIRVRQAIGRLKNLSLITVKAQRPGFSTHTLVHVWLRERQTMVKQIEVAREAMSLVLHALLEAYDTSQYAHAETIYPFLYVCLDHVYTMPSMYTATELQKIGACIIAIDAWVPFSLRAETLQRADSLFELIEGQRATAEWQIPEAMLAMRQAWRLGSMGKRRECGEHCLEFFSTFKPKTQFDKWYVSSMARTAAPCLYRIGAFDDAEQSLDYVDDSLDTTGAMLARKQIILGSIKFDCGLIEQALTTLMSCESEVIRGIGEEHFLYRVWHQLVASCYIAQGQWQRAETTVLPPFKRRLKMLSENKIEFEFSDYELAEVYACVLRGRRQHEEAKTLLTEVLDRTKSKKLRPSRSLAHLSMILVQLDEAIVSVASPGQTSGNAVVTAESITLCNRLSEIEMLKSKAHDMHGQAAAAYEDEWNRGTWVFRHFQKTMDNLMARVGPDPTKSATSPKPDARISPAKATTPERPAAIPRPHNDPLAGEYNLSSVASAPVIQVVRDATPSVRRTSDMSKSPTRSMIPRILREFPHLPTRRPRQASIGQQKQKLGESSS